MKSIAVFDTILIALRYFRLGEFPWMDRGMDEIFYLIDSEKEAEMGIITDDQVQFLIDNLAEDGVEDEEFYINEDVLEFLAENGCDEELLSLFAEGLEGRTDLAIHYEVR
ncbi:MAG: hypothetical protein OXN17_21290 [Candidatus Poribacteria bacterium]|nr:hypothetical protein [Candidatus Poribacteria bacterium]